MIIWKKIIVVVLLGAIFWGWHAVARESSYELDAKEAICIALDDINTWATLPKNLKIEVTEMPKSFIVNVLFLPAHSEGGDLNITIDKETKKIIKREVGQ